MLKGNNLNKIDTVLVLWISNVFRLGYIGHIAALASVASNTEVWKFIQIKNCRLPFSKGRQAGRQAQILYCFFFFSLPYLAWLLIKNLTFQEEKNDIWLKNWFNILSLYSLSSDSFIFSFSFFDILIKLFSLYLQTL